MVKLLWVDTGQVVGFRIDPPPDPNLSGEALTNHFDRIYLKNRSKIIHWVMGGFRRV